ncbi:MAG: CBS domain-containing protein [Gemmatimonadota bacterium]
MKIADILRTKGSAVVTISPEQPIQVAMRVLVEHNIGALVVVDGRLRGIITERDMLRTAAADVRRLESARVEDLMTVEVITTSPAADINHVMDVMTERRIRHLPVVDAGGVCGIISIGDVVNAMRQHVEAENRHLHAYITGIPL